MFTAVFYSCTSPRQKITTDIDLYQDSEVEWDAFLALIEQYQRPLPTKDQLKEAFLRVGNQPGDSEAVKGVGDERQQKRMSCL